ncbi:autophagy protein 17 [Acarospora aff. strigata]|nr:autophagy protein 17 [Acarospora aff. strigata]
MASPSEGSSDEQEDVDRSKTSLETLVSYLLASKRSLSSIDHVWRANEIVTSARTALEDIVLLRARTGFIQRGIDDQIKLLRTVRAGVMSVAREGQTEFKIVLKDLDDSEARLQQTLKQLRSTVVEAAFRPAEEEPKSLLDFVDEQGVQAVMTSLKESIDAISDAHRELETSNDAFDEDLKAVKKGLRAEAGPDSSQEDFNAPIPSLLHSLESHAKEVAELLESLVRHNELCVTAVKHTEGGGAAVEELTHDLPRGLDIGKSNDGLTLQPVSHEEYQEMMVVLEKDANEVDEVVMEIRDRVTEMESHYEQIIAYNNKLNSGFDGTKVAFHLLEKVGSSLPGYIAHSRDFVTQLDQERSKINDRKAELEGLGDFYQGFLRAYDELIVEVGRRRAVQLKIERVVQDAVTKTKRLYEEDMAEREAFRQHQGDFLPSDIWPGLLNSPIEYDILPVSKRTEDIPNLPKEALEEAIRRLRRKP